MRMPPGMRHLVSGVQSSRPFCLKSKLVQPELLSKAGKFFLFSTQGCSILQVTPRHAPYMVNFCVQPADHT
jgi:hypothetical protein